ncbi:MAG: hypothetical protein HRF49_11695 [bacterium]|jgi:acetyl-CoA decarbonylase/synthase complex subunit beta
MATVVSIDQFAGLVRSVVTTLRQTSVSRVGLPSLVINRYLADASQLLDGDVNDAVDVAKNNPALLLAAMELIEGSKLFGDEFLGQAEFMSLYLGDVPADAFLFAWDELEPITNLIKRGATVQIAKSRDSLVYFFQNLVRYAYHFGGVYQDPAALAKFFGYRPPGLILLTREPTDYELLILVALTKFRVPVWQIGERWLADQDFRLLSEYELQSALIDEYSTRGWHLLEPPTERSQEESHLNFRTVGGNYNSFFVVRSMGGVDGVEVRGETFGDIGVIVDIGDSDIDITMTGFIERELLKLLNRTGEVKAEQREWFVMQIDPAVTSPTSLGKLIYGLIRKEFDLKQVCVNIICDPLRLASLRAGIVAYQENRNKEIERQDELNASFYMCTRCRSYAGSHFCIVTAERPGHCGRSYEMIKTLAHASDSCEYLPVKKGELLDRRRGEYAGINKLARLMSGGKIKRLFLHSAAEHPHPSSAEFSILAFSIPRLGGIGLVHRGFRGVTPDGRTWNELEAAAVGRQCPGIVAVSPAYIHSKMFLAADGGPANILWMTSNLVEQLGWMDRRIATERECTNLTTLKNFYE